MTFTGKTERHPSSTIRVVVAVWKRSKFTGLAKGTLDVKTGGVRWDGKWPSGGYTKIMLDEYGTMVDRIVEWLLDPSMPPAGEIRATYDVEI